MSKRGSQEDGDDIVYFTTDRGPVVNCNNNIETIGSDLCLSGALKATIISKNINFTHPKERG